MSGKSGVASVRRGDREAWLYFDRGQVIDASVGDLRGEEAVYRTITWTTGSFNLEFRASDRQKVIDAPYQALLMEGLRQLDEFNALKDSLPNLRARVAIPELLIPPLRELSPDELDVLQLVHNYGTIEAVFNKSLALDLDTAQLLVKLLKKKYIAVRE